MVGLDSSTHKHPAVQQMTVPVHDAEVHGVLTIPRDCRGIILFAHGSGSSHTNQRHLRVAEHLHEQRLATLLFDLLTPQEDTHYALRFDISLLTQRLHSATEWIRHHPDINHLPMGYFSVGTGTAAALRAAADDDTIKAIVSRGGRPDLTGPSLLRTSAAVLLILGSKDLPLLELHQRAYDLLTDAKERELAIIEGASHLFEEPGALQNVARLAAEWFAMHLSR